MAPVCVESPLHSLATVADQDGVLVRPFPAWWSTLLAACMILGACSESSPPEPASVVALAVDARGLPRILHASGMTVAPADTPGESARLHVERLAGHWGVPPAATPQLDEIGALPVPGGTVVRLRQRIDGMPVYQAELRLLVRDAGELEIASGTLVGTHTPRLPARFVDDERTAIARAVERARGTRPDVRVDDARAEQVWYREEGGLIAAWVVEAYTSAPETTSGDLHRTVIADDGRVLAHESLVADATFSYRVFAEPTGGFLPSGGPIADWTPHPTGVPDGSYPAYVAPALVTVDSLNAAGDPWLSAGATQTSGNNVDAYADLYAPTGYGEGDFRSFSTGQAFDHVYDTSKEPLATTEQQMAAITSLFYVTNWLHDFWYDAGFTESAGNAQLFNYGRGGVEGDVLLAEAQDSAKTAGGGPRNNANMATPSDGMSPRMQVYLWRGRDTRTLTLQPSGRSPAVGVASYGPRDFAVSGAIIIGHDGTGASSTDGCTALTNAVADHLVLVDRGNCSYETKTRHAQDGGALGVIIADNVSASSPPSLGDDPYLTATITIGSLSVTQAEGATLKQEIAAGPVTGNAYRKVDPEVDGALDATLIAHEFGHYLHHRLSVCTTKMCGAMSEGWGDFVALLLLARAGDDLMGAFPFSVYATQSFPYDPAYFGIRRAPYSADFAINALSFRHMANGEPLPSHHPMLSSAANSQVHAAGEVWASTLWEVYVALQRAGASFDDVRAKMARYVVSGLLLAPTDASPVEMRDALLAAALVTDPADHAIMIEAFARRGFGSCAVAPPPSSTDFVGLVESTVVAGIPRLVDVALVDNCDADGVLDAGERARVTARLVNHGHAPLTDVSITLRSQTTGVRVLTPPVTLGRLEPFATADVAVEVALDAAVTGPIAGDLVLEVTAAGGCEGTTKHSIGFRLDVDDVPSTATVDRFDTAGSLWQPSTTAWTHVRETALDGQWHGADASTRSDTRLTSPVLVAADDAPVVMTFSHRHSFEHSGGIAWDGGVVEVSVDGGVTWTDVVSLAAIGYNGTLTSTADNVLGGRLAFVGSNAAWPNTDTVTIDFGTALAGTTFRVRFRIGTDAYVEDHGWDIDDVAFSGIRGSPFSSQVADDGACDSAEPVGEPDEPASPPEPGVPQRPADPHDPAVPVDGEHRSGCDAGQPSGGVLALGLLGLLGRRAGRSPWQARRRQETVRAH